MCMSIFQNEVHLLKPGDKVGASDATLLNMLKVSPFSYGLAIQQGKECHMHDMSDMSTAALAVDNVPVNDDVDVVYVECRRLVLWLAIAEPNNTCLYFMILT